MQPPNILAESGLDRLSDLASFPNLEQIGIILLLVAVVGLIVLASMLKGVKSLRSAMGELTTQLRQAAPTQAVASLAAAQGAAMAVGLEGPGYAPPLPAEVPGSALAVPPAGPPVQAAVPFAAVLAEPGPEPVPAPAPTPIPTSASTGFGPPDQAAGPVEAVAVAPVPSPEAPPPTASAALVDSGALPKALSTAARREISLVGRALKILDELEQSETDPDKLFSLFALDNLMARMRRGSEAQMILAGRDPERSVREALSVSDVIRTASSQIEHYERIRISLDWDPMIPAYAVVPAAHLIAELLENATGFSPEGAVVEVGSSNHSGDVVLTISDTGVGMTPQELAAANRMMQVGGNPDDLTHGRLGVAVVARLAGRLGAAVSFAPGQGEDGNGTTAIVRIPARLVDEHPAQPGLAEPEAEPALPPQPKLEESAVEAAPSPEESFQPIQVA
ncbi:MAG: hypothetical protein LBG11_08820, partial [Bifidobacteriaceae bacterium]|nr:hypothetical protein [Bifidobacteriaceae bacterium]